jgi:hypothetical protein
VDGKLSKCARVVVAILFFKIKSKGINILLSKKKEKQNLFP